MLTPWKESYDKSRVCIKKQRYHFANKGPSSGFSSSHVQIWELDYKEGWVLKNWCFWITVLKNTLESPLDSKEIKPVNSKGNQSCIFIERTDAEAPILWPPDAKSPFIGRHPDAGKDWRQEKKGVIGNKTVGGIIDSMGMSLSKLQGIVRDREAWYVAVHGVTRSWTWLSNWKNNKFYKLSSPRAYCTLLK